MSYNENITTQRMIRQGLKELGFDFDTLGDLMDEFGDELVNFGKLVHPVRYSNSSRYNGLIKVKKNGSPQQNQTWADNTLSVYKAIRDNPDIDEINILSIIGGPYDVAGYKGLLMPLGVINGSAYAYSKPNFSQDEFISIMLQITNGLRKIHLSKFKHRDLKGSQYILQKFEKFWQDQIWDLGDYETASTSDDTTTKKNDPNNWSPEFWKRKVNIDGPTKGNFFYPEQEDIFALGMSFYNMRALPPIPLQTQWNNSTIQEYQAFILQAIEKLPFSKVTKYYLRRFLSPEFPSDGKIPSGKREDHFRFRSAQHAWEELSDPYKGNIHQVNTRNIQSVDVQGKIIPLYDKGKLPENHMSVVFDDDFHDKPNETSFVHLREKPIIAPPPSAPDPKDSEEYKEFSSIYNVFTDLLEHALSGKKDAIGFIEDKLAFDLNRSFISLKNISNNKKLAGLQDLEEKTDKLLKEYRINILFPEQKIILDEAKKYSQIGRELKQSRVSSFEELKEKISELSPKFIKIVQRAEIYLTTADISRSSLRKLYRFETIKNNKTPTLKTIVDTFNQYGDANNF